MASNRILRATDQHEKNRGLVVVITGVGIGRDGERDYAYVAQGKFLRCATSAIRRFASNWRVRF
jgi:hypothetical protein